MWYLPKTVTNVIKRHVNNYVEYFMKYIDVILYLTDRIDLAIGRFALPDKTDESPVSDQRTD